MTRPESAVPPGARTAAEAEQPARSDNATPRPQQAGSVQRSRLSSPPIDHPRSAEQNRRSRDPGTPSPTSSEFGNPGGNWLG